MGTIAFNVAHQADHAGVQLTGARGYTPMGSTHVQVEQEAEFEALATFERSDPAAAFKLSKVEIVDGPSDIDFGFVEADYAPEPEDGFQLPDLDSDGEGEATP